MTTHPIVERDERTVAVETASYKWAYLFIIYALFMDVMYRAFVRNEAAWDLMTLVVMGGAVCAVYQARQKTMPGSLALALVLCALAFPICIAALYKFQLLR